MWRGIKHDLAVVDFAKVNWLQIYESKRRLGYGLTLHEVTVLRNAGRWAGQS